MFLRLSPPLAAILRYSCIFRATISQFRNLRKGSEVEHQSILNLIPMPLGGVDLADMEGEWVLYSYERETMIYLNDSAHVIWRLCDGKRTVKEITDVLANAFPDAEKKITIDVSETIQRLMQEGILKLGEA